MASTFIDDVGQLKQFLDQLTVIAGTAPQLFIDLEGHNISSGGALSLLQLVDIEQRLVYLIDLFVLGEDAFDTAGSSGLTLRTILESSTPAKAFFDVRADSSALYRHHKIRLAGIQDIQLMQIASGTQSQRCVNGLARCIEHDIRLTPKQKESWLTSKDVGKKLFDPKLGGSYAIFDQRPLPQAVRTYCSQDVLLLPALWLQYYQKLSREWFHRVLDESANRVRESQKPTYTGGRHRAFGPRRWMYMRRDPFPFSGQVAPPKFIENCRALVDQLQQISPDPSPKKISRTEAATPKSLESLLADLGITENNVRQASQQG